jgi:hypothetical protein
MTLHSHQWAMVPSSPQYGLEWPGTGATRRMLYWHSPPAIYDMTYIFKVYPRAKVYPTDPNCYWTTFFWGNDGIFAWNGGNGGTYYGAHPYPFMDGGAPNGRQQWEIAIYASDIPPDAPDNVEVTWNRWYTQAFRAWRESSSITHHEFYYDLPDTSKIISYDINDAAWAASNPPTPAIVIGQTGDNGSGQSWGGYEGWEEFNGVIRGIQIYSGLLTLADIASEIASPQSTSAGNSAIWYLNTNPRPSDVTDKKSGGTAHNPSWDGTTAIEWTG